MKCLKLRYHYTYNIKYVGADVYNRIICQDKNISKELAKKAGILVPDSVTINSLDNLNTFNLHLLKYPVVIKPLMEGSSIGITKNSLCQNANNIKEKIENFIKPITNQYWSNNLFLEKK